MSYKSVKDVVTMLLENGFVFENIESTMVTNQGVVTMLLETSS